MQPSEVLWKKVFLIISQISQETSCVGVSLYSSCKPWLDLPLDYKETATQVFSCKICAFFQMTYFEEHLRTTASDTSKGIFPNISTAKFMLKMALKIQCPWLLNTVYCLFSREDFRHYQLYINTKNLYFEKVIYVSLIRYISALKIIWSWRSFDLAGIS